MIDNKLITFMTLCEEKSYTKTAERLYVTQPSVTHHIKQLEKEYDCKLFSNKDFELTKEGSLIYKYAESLLAYDEQFNRLIEETKKGKTAYTFLATEGANKGYMKLILSSWYQQNPDFVYHYEIKNVSDVIKGLALGTADFAVVDYPFSRKAFNSITLYKSRIILAVGKTHPLAQARKVSFNETIKYPLLLDSKNSTKSTFITTDLKLKNHTLSEYENLNEMDSFDTIVDLVQSGVAMSYFYETEIEDYIKRGLLIPLEVNEIKNSVEFYFMYNKGNLRAEELEKLALEFQKLHKEVNYSKYTSNLK